MRGVSRFELTGRRRAGVLIAGFIVMVSVAGLSVGDLVLRTVGAPTNAADVVLTIAAGLVGVAGAVLLVDVRRVRARASAVAAEKQAAEERLQLLLDGARDYALMMLDPDGRITSWSASAQRMKGYTEAEALGHDYAAFFPEEAIAAGEPRRILAEAAGTGRSEVEGEQVRKDGTRFWARGYLNSLHNADGTLRGFVKVTQDVTQRRRAEAKFHDLLEATPDAIVGVQEDGRISMVNGHAEQLFGYLRAELLGASVDILVPELRRAIQLAHESDQPVIKEMGTGLEWSARHKDGGTFPTEISLSTLDTEDGLVFSAAIRDVSDRKAAQRAIEELNTGLQQLNDELELRVADRTAELVAQAEKLQQANDELESFSYSVSHDLRAPLRAITGFAGILREDCAHLLPPDGRENIDLIELNGRQMSQLIDDLLTFSRLQRHTLRTGPVDMDKLVRQCWDELIDDATRERATLRIQPDLPACTADSRPLKQVLLNLLGNAVKYSRPREHILIEVGSIDQNGVTAYFIRDNGTGFDMRYAHKLFQVFQRLHDPSEYEGTGIGLALVQRIITRHGGRVWAEAAPDRGATFFYTLESSHHGTQDDDQPEPVGASRSGRGDPVGGGQSQRREADLTGV